MALLTPNDYKEVRSAVYRRGAGKEELKSLAVLPDKAHFLAAFQSFENDMTAAFPGIKSNMDAALGATTTQGLARKMFAAYLRWKLKQLGV
jgi:hypothetical protein